MRPMGWENSSKEAIFDVLAAEFPGEIRFLTSYDTEAKQQQVNEAAARSRTVRARMEALKAKEKPASAKGVSASLFALRILEAYTSFKTKSGDFDSASGLQQWFSGVERLPDSWPMARLAITLDGLVLQVSRMTFPTQLYMAL